MSTISPKRKIGHLVLLVVFIFLCLCAAPVGGYRYATYDSLCLGGSLGRYDGYIFYVINPDVDVVSGVLRDYLLEQLSNRPELNFAAGYPQKDRTIDSWPVIRDWNLPFSLPGQPYVVQDTRSIYWIKLEPAISIELYYHQRASETVAVPSPMSGYIFPRWPSSSGSLNIHDAPMVEILVVVMDPKHPVADAQVEKIYDLIEDALDHFPACTP